MGVVGGWFKLCVFGSGGGVPTTNGGGRWWIGSRVTFRGREIGGVYRVRAVAGDTQCAKGTAAVNVRWGGEYGYIGSFSGVWERGVLVLRLTDTQACPPFSHEL